MRNFDIDNLVNAALVETALIQVDGMIVSVIDMDNDTITVLNKDLEEQVITDNDWSPIFLDDLWMERLNLKGNQQIRNIHTHKDWTIRRSGRYHYLTIDKDISLGENPVIPVHTVHELQAWYNKLTETNLNYRLSEL